MPFPTETNAIPTSPTAGALGGTTPTLSALFDLHRASALSIRDKINTLGGTAPYFKALILNGIGGTTVGDFNAAAVVRTGLRLPTTYTDPQTNVWTVTGGAWDWNT